MSVFAARVVVLALGVACIAGAGMPTPGAAKPKGQGGAGSCTCACVTSSQIQIANYNSQGYPCEAFNGATCNVEDPATGGIRSGQLLSCGNAISVSVISGRVFLLRGANANRMMRRRDR
jgi:hypothetical protein